LVLDLIKCQLINLTSETYDSNRVLKSKSYWFHYMLYNSTSIVKSIIFKGVMFRKKSK